MGCPNRQAGSGLAVRSLGQPSCCLGGGISEWVSAVLVGYSENGGHIDSGIYIGDIDARKLLRDPHDKSAPLDQKFPEYDTIHLMHKILSTTLRSMNENTRQMWDMFAGSNIYPTPELQDLHDEFQEIINRQEKRYKENPHIETGQDWETGRSTYNRGPDTQEDRMLNTQYRRLRRLYHQARNKWIKDNTLLGRTFKGGTTPNITIN